MSLLVTADDHFLNPKQEARLLSMTATLRADPALLAQVAEIKRLLSEDDLHGALALWEELEDTERTKVWIAPRYGGLFTTKERERIKWAV